MDFEEAKEPETEAEAVLYLDEESDLQPLKAALDLLAPASPTGENFGVSCS